MGRPAIDLTGKVFGNLTCVNKKGKNKKGSIIWGLKCACGEECSAVSSDLMRGRTNFCTKCSKEKSKKSPFKSLYGSYKRGASKRGLNFDLLIEYFISLLTSNCYYCDYPPKQNFKKDGSLFGCLYNGIDRVDNSKGYTKENSVPCCKFCNFSKSKGTEEEFKEWLLHIKPK